MIPTADFQKGMFIKLDSQSWMIVDYQFVKPGKGTAFVKTKLKNLRTGNVVEKSFKSYEEFEEADVEKIKAKYLYSHRDSFFFCKEDEPSFRFELSKELMGNSAGFLKANQIVDAVVIDGKITHVSLPIKIQLKITEAPPGVRGERAQAGTKTVVLETGAQINVPLFVEQDDIIEVNTETGEYVRREIGRAHV